MPAASSCSAAAADGPNAKILFRKDGASVREPELLDPAIDAAKIRAIFVHPNFARRSLGSCILAHVDSAAFAASFRRFDNGLNPYRRPTPTLKGYVEVERIAVPLPNGEALPVVKTTKNTVESRVSHNP